MLKPFPIDHSTGRKVCMFLNAPIAGDQRVFREARALAEAGFEVSILCNQEPEPVSSAWDGIKIYAVPRRPSAVFPGRFTIDWVRLAVRLRPDVVHAHDLNTLGRAWLVSRITGAKLVYDSHDFYQETHFIRRMPRWRRWYYRNKEGFLCRRSDRVIQVVPENSLRAAQEFRIRQPATIANYPPLDPLARSRVLHDIFGFSSATRIAIYEGVVVKDRGLGKLVQSGRYLPPGVAIVILGEGYLKPALKKMAKEEGLDERVKFIDEVKLEDFPAYCAASDIGIAIYENEGLLVRSPTKVFNYMRAGIPVLGGGSGVTDRVISENNIGVVIEDFSPRAIANAISDILTDPRRYEVFRLNALRVWRERYNWTTEAKKLLELYQVLLLG